MPLNMFSILIVTFTQQFTCNIIFICLLRGGTFDRCAKISRPCVRIQNLFSDQLCITSSNFHRRLPIAYAGAGLGTNFRNFRAGEKRLPLVRLCTLTSFCFSASVVCVYMPTLQSERYLGFRDGG